MAFNTDLEDSASIVSRLGLKEVCLRLMGMFLTYISTYINLISKNVNEQNNLVLEVSQTAVMHVVHVPGKRVTKRSYIPTDI